MPTLKGVHRHHEGEGDDPVDGEVMVVVVAIQNLFPIMAQSAHGHTTGRPRLRLRKIEIMEPAVEAPFKRIENALASVAR